MGHLCYNGSVWDALESQLITRVEHRLVDYMGRVNLRSVGRETEEYQRRNDGDQSREHEAL